jgi:uncharacterized membrane protein YccC
MGKLRVKNDNGAPLQLTEVADLLGKKSVRATFKLHPTTIELLSVLAAQLGIKQKSLFDYLMEDKEALCAMATSSSQETSSKEQRVQKTYVVSQRSLTMLESVTQQSSASRDDLIERSIQRLLPVLEKERNRQKNRSKALAKISYHLEEGNALLEDVEELGGKEDAIFQSLDEVLTAFSKVYMKIEKRVDKGRRISEFPIDALRQDQPKHSEDMQGIAND